MSGSSTTPTTSSPTFAERLRAATEREQQARRTFRWFRGPRASFAPDVAVEPNDSPRTRDEFVTRLRDAS